MAESEIEERCESPGIVFQRDMLRSVDHGGGDRDNDNTIHSGQFMMSFVHDDESKEAEAESEAASEKQQQDIFKQLLGDWRFGTRKQAELHIDTSLRKLFECMTLTYRQVV